MNFLANENFPLLSVTMLRTAGLDVASVIKETPGASDNDVLKRAHEEDRIILTFDKDYGELIYRHKLLTPPGVVYFKFNPVTPAEPAQYLLKILKDSAITLQNKFTVLKIEPNKPEK